MKIMYNKIGDFMNSLKNCTLCPHNCKVDRTKTLGFCKANDKLKIARADLYYYEEPCISGTQGSGAIFFSNCNLKCIYCQNYEISCDNIGKEITINHLVDILLDLQKQNALNINLVTPTHYVPLIIKALKIAKQKGLTIPIVYNTSSYENVETIKSLNGLIDIYLPDFKYYDDKYAIKYSKAPNYFKYAKDAINEMFKQVGKPVFDENNNLKKGVLIRHLILPNLKEDSKKIIKYIYDTYKDNVYISIMNQYTQIKNYKYEELNRKITNEEYDEIIEYAYDLGIRNAYVQEKGTVDESFIPDFKTQNF